MKRIGFACKWIDNADQIDGIKPNDSAKKYNTGTTTIAWLDRQSKKVAEEKIWDLMVSNITSVQKLVDKVGTLDSHLRMVRLSSDILPVFTHSSYSYFWKQADVIAYLEKNLILVGDSARKNNVRLSFHPGQFTVLASINPGIIEKSIEEFEYHASMAAWMGYAKKFQDFKINIHISGKLGPDGIRAAYTRLSPEARNCITIENEENSWGLADCLTIGDLVPIVLDVHHNWIREGKYISPDDTQVKQVIDSWRGVRPTMHYSVSREDYLVDHTSKIAPCHPELLSSKHNKQKLRAHSDFYWNDAVSTWAASFWENFDIMCESKAKNLASFAFAEHAKKFTSI
jgi:UV DNA damage endonuclease